jgi:hypothetical protein
MVAVAESFLCRDLLEQLFFDIAVTVIAWMWGCIFFGQFSYWGCLFVCGCWLSPFSVVFGIKFLPNLVFFHVAEIDIVFVPSSLNFG